MHVQILQKNDFYYWKSVAHKFGFVKMFMFWPITLKQLNSLTLIDTFSSHGSVKVMFHTAVQEVRGSILRSGKYM